MQFKSLLVIGAIFAPLLAAAPAGDSEAKSVDAGDMEMDPSLKILASKEGLDTILQEAISDKSDTESQDNVAWRAFPPWPY
ncbi:hypothetical protein FHL15_007914 [Xylaria flabelliformis]|uniref:Uncharacterized protein n=1 Tax=Xylaria flabelliformis TaxID=2512241 RepID=A0A553HT43_9PEZI|nr:hypothetical protein FHL15_007914 [Xylaria flabelliformis]